MAGNTNPFNLGAGLDPPYLAGRDDEIAIFSQTLMRIKDGMARNMLIYGHRGMGKTALLNRFGDICSKKGFLPVFQSQYGSKHSNPDLFQRALQYELDRALSSIPKSKNTRQKIKSTTIHPRPKTLGVSELLAYEPACTVRENAPFEDQIFDYIVQALSVLEKSNLHGIVFLFDEFHTLRDVKSREWQALTDFLAVINMLQIDQHRCMFVLSGLPDMVGNILTARHNSERMFEFIEISNFGEDDVKNAILTPLKGTAWRFSEQLVSALLCDTGAHPYLVQFFCSEIMERSNKKRIGIDEYHFMRDSILEKLGKKIFAPRLRSIRGYQRKLLCAMASLEGYRTDSSSIRDAAGMDTRQTEEALERLEDKGLIYRPERGIYRFTLPLLKKYLAETAESKGY